MRLDPQAASTEVSQLTLLSCQAPQADSIASFPTTGQPVLDSTLKDMLMFLRSFIQADMLSFILNFGNKMSVVEERTSYIESNLGDITAMVNDIIDSQDKQMEDKWIKDKSSDLEDRLRQNNLKICGVLESVPNFDLSQYVRGLVKVLLPDLKNIELTIDCIHRLPKPPFLSESVPRDVILGIHFYHVKEQLMQEARHMGTLPDPYGQVQLFADLSQHTLSRHRQLNTITKALRNHHVQWIQLI